MAGLSAVWALAFISFWVWWLEPGHIASRAGIFLNSLVLLHMSYLSGYFLIMANRLRQVSPDLEVPELRTAFVVTKAPSEPWDLVKTTILAMLAQAFPRPYDVWLCDEEPTKDVLNWCRARGVRVSTRQNAADYHQREWPRRTRCKEGNLAYFYDHWGYEGYDVVAQLDCDHVPSPTYLAEVVRPFADPAIGYVAAPSINDSNAGTSWVSRGRLHCEATLHGPVQLGHSDGLAPLCIGSHYAVRTVALREVGGIGPELAEDFSTTLLLTSAGWKSAFAHKAEAHGAGPNNFTSMATQEFQWSRSLMTLFMNTAPGHFRRLSWSLRIRFFFALAYYPILSLATLLGLGLTVVPALTGHSWVQVNFFEFFIRWLSVDIATLGVIFYIRRKKLLRPQAAPLISWEGCMYMMVRWPFVVWGIVAALRQKFRPLPLEFRVTPKSFGDLEPLPARLMLPNSAVAAVLALGALVGEAVTGAYGYIFLCIVGAVCYSTAAVVVPLIHARESSRAAAVPFKVAARRTAAVPLAMGGCASILALSAALGYPAYLLNVVGS